MKTPIIYNKLNKKLLALTLNRLIILSNLGKLNNFFASKELVELKRRLQEEATKGENADYTAITQELEKYKLMNSLEELEASVSKKSEKEELVELKHQHLSKKANKRSKKANKLVSLLLSYKILTDSERKNIQNLKSELDKVFKENRPELERIQKLSILNEINVIYDKLHNKLVEQESKFMPKEFWSDIKIVLGFVTKQTGIEDEIIYDEICQNFEPGKILDLQDDLETKIIADRKLLSEFLLHVQSELNKIVKSINKIILQSMIEDIEGLKLLSEKSQVKLSEKDQRRIENLTNELSEARTFEERSQKYRELVRLLTQNMSLDNIFRSSSFLLEENGGVGKETIIENICKKVIERNILFSETKDKLKSRLELTPTWNISYLELLLLNSNILEFGPDKIEPMENAIKDVIYEARCDFMKIDRKDIKNDSKIKSIIKEISEITVTIKNYLNKAIVTIIETLSSWMHNLKGIIFKYDNISQKLSKDSEVGNSSNVPRTNTAEKRSELY